MGKRLLVVFMASCMVVVGVGSIASAAVPTLPKDACKMVTAADVGEAFGLTATEGESGGDKGKSTFCRWEMPIDTTFTNDEGASVSLQSSGTFGISCDKLSAVTKKDFKTNSKGATAEKIPGLKKSFFDSEGTIVVLIKGTTFCNIQWTGPLAISADPDGLKDAVIALAKQAAKKA